MLAGVALVLVIAAFVAGRVKFGSFLPGILIVVAIAAIGAFFTLRSHQPAARKAMVVSAMVLVIAVAIPASSKVAFPVYSHFFGQKSGQASQAGTASPGEGAATGGSGSRGGAPSSSGPAAAAPKSGGAKSGVLVATGSTTERTYGFIDPGSGNYSKIASFNLANTAGGVGGLQTGDVSLSPDLTKLAATEMIDGQRSAGWIDTSGNFTRVTPKFETGAFGGNAPSYQSVGFDGAGNYYYTKITGGDVEGYKLAAGSTSNAQKVASGTGNEVFSTGVLNYDGSMLLQCGIRVNWLGPNYAVEASTTQINKVAIKGTDDKGCPQIDTTASKTPLLPQGNVADVKDAIGNHDGTKVVFKYLGPSAHEIDNPSLYTVNADGSSQPTKINLPNLAGSQLSQMTFIKWI
ncbi:hypothetical protein [Mycobacterium noviomagense]|uniref:hypothetical protein n=1 Tax=Mycobacterium noviomagense TaxID=459858 RepID=UPI00111C92B7|nr:hypothetical protein [Mycobacterium noviomagense]